MIVRIQTGYHVSNMNGMAIVNDEVAQLASSTGFHHVTPREAVSSVLIWRAAHMDIERRTQQEVIEA